MVKVRLHSLDGSCRPVGIHCLLVMQSHQQILHVRWYSKRAALMRTSYQKKLDKFSLMNIEHVNVIEDPLWVHTLTTRTANSPRWVADTCRRICSKAAWWHEHKCKALPRCIIKLGDQRSLRLWPVAAMGMVCSEPRHLWYLYDVSDMNGRANMHSNYLTTQRHWWWCEVTNYGATLAPFLHHATIIHLQLLSIVVDNACWGYCVFN